MTHILTEIVLLGIAVSAARLLGKRQAVTAKSGREARPENEPVARREPPETRRGPMTAPVPIRDTKPADPPDYLLGGRRGGGATDRTAAMTDMMSGNGVCTPRKGQG